MRTLKGNPSWQQEKVIREIIKAGAKVFRVRVKDSGEAVVGFEVDNRLKVWVLNPEGEAYLRTV